MQERFKELLLQAIREVGPADADRGAKEKTLQRFADLIVCECVLIAHEASEVIFDHKRMVDPRTFCGNQIVLHFYGDEPDEEADGQSGE